MTGASRTAGETRPGPKTDRGSKPGSLRGSLGRSLLLLGAVPSGISLIAASISFLVFESNNARQDVLERGVLLAEVAAANSAPAVLFEDPEAGIEALEPLAADPTLEVACLYDHDGDHLARFLPGSGRIIGCPSRQREFAEVSDGLLRVFMPIHMGGERVGWLYLQSDADSIGDRFVGYLTISSAVLVVSILFSLALSAMLRRRITEPLGSLIDSSVAVTHGDLSQPSPVAGDDEIGALASAFGTMADGLRDLVSQIQQSSTSVREMSESLRSASELMEVAESGEVEAIEQLHASALRTSGSAEQLNERAESVTVATSNAAAEITRVDISVASVSMQMDGLADTINDTVASIGELSATTSSIGTSLEQLHAATQSTISSLGVIDDASQGARALATETQSLSDEMVESSKLGKSSVDETVETMAEIQQSFDQIQQIVVGLSTSSQSIGEIVSVIDGFATGSRMLALNAQIIASQAGEHGRSFAVVAHQVNELASRASRSVTEIERLVASVQRGTEEAVEAVSSGVARVNRGVSQSRIAGVALVEIQELARRSSDRVGAIAGQTDSQTEQIGAARMQVDHVGQIVEVISNATREQLKASANLANASEEIRSSCTTVKDATAEQRASSSQITSAVSEVHDMMHQTLRASRAQIDDAGTIQRALEVLRHKVGESHKANAEVNRIVASMAERAASLEEIVGRFRL